MKIGILGSGSVAQALAAGFLGHGHAVTLGTRSPDKLAAFLSANPGAKVASGAEVAAQAEVLVLAVKGGAASEALHLAGAVNLEGKTVIDTTNPIADAPPNHGVLNYFTGPNESLMERLQKAFPSVRFVKAFNSVGAALMANPKFAGGTPTMFICGNDDGAKKTVAGLLEQLGWDAYDVGLVEAARPIESLCALWCAPGLARNDWSPRAFKLLR